MSSIYWWFTHQPDSTQCVPCGDGACILGWYVCVEAKHVWKFLVVINSTAGVWQPSLMSVCSLKVHACSISLSLSALRAGIFTTAESSKRHLRWEGQGRGVVRMERTQHNNHFSSYNKTECVIENIWKPVKVCIVMPNNWNTLAHHSIVEISSVYSFLRQKIQINMHKKELKSFHVLHINV